MGSARQLGAISFSKLVVHAAWRGQSGQLRRTLLLLVTVAVTVAAWWVLSAMASPFVTLAHQEKSQDIAVHTPKTGGINHTMPKRYATKIAALPDARRVYYSDLDIITCGSGFSVTISALGGPGTAGVLLADGYSKAQIDAFMQDRLAILTNSKTASRCGWHIGLGVSPKNMYGRPMELHVKGIIHATDSGAWAIAHYAYINRVGGVTKRNMVTGIYVHALDPRDNAALAARIQEMFAHSDPPVVANPNTVTQNAWARFGKVQYLLAFVMAAIFACCILVLTSVMAHAAMQRRPRMALLQVLGFPRAMHWTALVLEIIPILAVGAAIGFGLGQLAIYGLQRTLGETFQSITAPPSTTTWLWPGLCLLLIASMLVPSVIVARLRPTDCRDP